LGIGAKFLTFVLTALLFLSAGAVAPAFAATYYVATTGNDSNIGSQGSPWRTIAHAVSRMNAGDTTYVRGGVYNEGRIWFKKSGTASAPIRLLNAPGESPIVDFGSTESNRVVHRFDIYAGSTTPIGWITIEGFEIRRGYEGIKMINGHDVVIRRNWIHHATGQGIGGNGKNILIDRNVISHNGGFERCARGDLTSSGGTICNQAHGIYTTGPNWVITNNLIYDNLAIGISVAGYEHCPDGSCYGGSPGARGKTFAGPDYGGADGWLIANNTIAYNNYGPAINIWQAAAKNIRIVNNILYENRQKDANGTNGVSFLNSGGGHIIQDNICYGTAPGATACIGGHAAGKYTGSNNVTVNPNFVGAGPVLSGAPNFQLQASSPAIDKGQTLSQVTWDHAGGKRPFGSSHDIGAYEYGAPPDSGSPPPNPTGDGGITPGGESGVCPPGMVPAPGSVVGGISTPPVTTPPPAGSTTPPPSGSGTTYYVSTTGNDSNNGMQSLPFRTVQKAVGVVRAGDTVIIKPGRHAPFDLRNINGASGAPITFFGEPGAIIDRNLGGSNRYRNIEFWGGSYITIDGLELTDSDPGGGPTSCTGTGTGAGRTAIKLNRAARGQPYPHHLVFTNLNIHGVWGTAILGSAESSQLLYSHIYDNGGKNKAWSPKPEAYGTYLKGRGWVIRGNRIHDHTGNGIRTGNDPSTGTSELLVDSIIENNLIYDNGGTFNHPSGAYGSPDFHCALVTGGDGIVVWHGSGNIIRNNIVYNNRGYGIRVNENFGLSNKPNLIYNNTVYKSGGTGIYCYAGDKTIVKNNISYIAGWAIAGRPEIFSGCTNQLSNNLTTDPRFVNPAGGDFHLQPGSPAIDRGVTLSEVPQDFYWGARPFGSAYDIGAIEQGAPPGTAPDGGFLPGEGGGMTGGGILCVPQSFPDTYVPCIPPDP